jgi:hypothetical protein
MTTVASARAALVTAVGASDYEIDPPACYVFSSGSDLTNLGGRGTRWTFRVVCAVGIPGDFAQSSATLAALVEAKLQILWALAGWQVDSVGPDHTSLIAGGEQFTADIAVSTPVHI